MYSTGRGTAKDLSAAYALLSAAANAGDGRGKDLQRSIESQLTAAEIAEAKEKARHLTTTASEPLSAKALLP
jgi:TPR repeat protein